MGFLSTIGALIFGAGFIRNELRHSINDEKFYKDAKQKGYNSWTDSYGKTYDMETGVQIRGWRIDGHNVALNAKTGKIVRDYTQEQNEAKEREYLAEVIKNGERFYRAPTVGNGFIYKDRVTGKIFEGYPGQGFIQKEKHPTIKNFFVMTEPFTYIKENKMPEKGE